MKKNVWLRYRLVPMGSGLLLLLTLLLGVLGQWAFVVVLLIMCVLYSLIVFVFLTILKINRTSGLDDNQLPFTFLPIYRMLYTAVDPRSSQSTQEQIEQDEKDLGSFKFKDSSVTNVQDE